MYPEPWNYGSIQQNHDNIIYTRMRASIESAFLAKYNTGFLSQYMDIAASFREFYVVQ